MGRQAVMGQTGSVVLSDTMLQHKASQNRTVRYRYVKVAHGFRTEVIGPFHSSLYGANSFGTSRIRSKEALQRRLGNDHGYIGRMLIADKDEADTVGVRYPNEMTSGAPITIRELVGAAGV